MNQFLVFVRKEFYHIFRDRRTILILLVMPVVQIVLFGFALTTEVRNVRVAIYDPSGDEVTQRLIDRIDANEYLDVTTTVYDYRQIDGLFQRNIVDLVIVFQPPFSNDMVHTSKGSIQLVTDDSDPNTSATIVGYVKSIILNSQQDVITQMSGSNTLQIPIASNTQFLFNPGMKSAYNFVPGVLGMVLLLICAQMTSISIVREKEMGNMEVLLVSPVKPLFVVLTKSIPYLVISCANLATILLLSRFVLNVPIRGELLLMLGTCMLYIMLALSLGLLISTITETQVAALITSGMTLMMPVMLLSGLIFPCENMPFVLQVLSDVIPAKWFISAMRKIMIEGVGFTYVIKELSVLSGMTILLLIISTKKFKNRLE